MAASNLPGPRMVQGSNSRPATYAPTEQLPAPPMAPADDAFLPVFSQPAEEIRLPSNVQSVGHWGTATVTFGKRKGWTYIHVFNQDPSYCTWVLGHTALSASAPMRDLKNYIRAKNAWVSGLEPPAPHPPPMPVTSASSHIPMPAQGPAPPQETLTPLLPLPGSPQQRQHPTGIWVPVPGPPPPSMGQPMPNSTPVSNPTALTPHNQFADLQSPLDAGHCDDVLSGWDNVETPGFQEANSGVIPWTLPATSPPGIPLPSAPPPPTGASLSPQQLAMLSQMLSPEQRAALGLSDEIVAIGTGNR